MRNHRRLAASVGLAVLLTTAASTTYAQNFTPQQGGEGGQGGHDNSLLCAWLHWCKPGGGGRDLDPVPVPLSATPELDSLLLFGFGLTGLGGYAVTRYRARRRW